MCYWLVVDGLLACLLASVFVAPRCSLNPFQSVHPRRAGVGRSEREEPSSGRHRAWALCAGPLLVPGRCSLPARLNARPRCCFCCILRRLPVCPVSRVTHSFTHFTRSLAHLISKNIIIVWLGHKTWREKVALKKKKSYTTTRNKTTLVKLTTSPSLSRPALSAAPFGSLRSATSCALLLLDLLQELGLWRLDSVALDAFRQCLDSLLCQS